ncbi:hypothetical protein BUALT_Bualt09G0013300 [Buddleja alternifolia]|uniref:Retrovirus-related Pol polyprotein from transposon TNT 1-94-like beta-barrel domain-containing protein n=1 Tax=Buddleja alternifolia TaxID=168488 RepID=A0AAV6X076_9LAMI|nr:hypothetical protein BUALT_Bualt09G0013300 [Buddleja alternifolia]
MWQEIDMFHNISWKCSDDGVLYSKMLEKDRIFDFLQGLNQDLDDVRGRILGIKPLPPLKEVFAEVRREETRRKVMSLPHTTETVGSALVKKRSDGNNLKGAVFGKDKQIWCDHCKKPNHTKDTCWDFHGKPADWKPQNQRKKEAYSAETTVGANPSPFTTEQLEVLKKLMKSTAEESNSAGLWALIAQKGKVSLLSYKTTYGSWIVDTGASDHMTGSNSRMSNYEPCREKVGITVADGTICTNSSILVAEKLLDDFTPFLKAMGSSRSSILPESKSLIVLPGCELGLLESWSNSWFCSSGVLFSCSF